MSKLSSDPEVEQAHQTGHWTNSTQQGEAKHFSGGKVPLHQLPRWVLWQVAKALKYGELKYGKWNWRAGMPFTEILDSAQRHMDDWLEGNDLDHESRLHHLDHAICDLMFLRWYTKNVPAQDNRPPRPEGFTNLYEMEGSISPELQQHWEGLRRKHGNKKLQQPGQTEGQEA